MMRLLIINLTFVLQVLEAIFVFCCVWSLGACVVQKPGCEDRDRYKQLQRLLFVVLKFCYASLICLSNAYL